MKIALSGNKGEWSETYVLLSLLSSGKIQIVDEEFRPTGSVMGLVAVERGNSPSKAVYRPKPTTSQVIVDSGGEIVVVDIAEIEESAKKILETLQGAGISSGIPEVETLLAKLRIAKLAATSDVKADIRLVVQDSKSTSRLELPMSIKSLIGSPPTLLNASGATNFEFRFTCNHSLESELRSLGRKPKSIIQRLLYEQVSLTSTGPVNSVFRSNLMISDSALPDLLSHLVLSYYSGSTSGVLELVNQLALVDPLGVGSKESQKFYISKIRALLADVALGMTPSKSWDGRYSASGGYLVVKPDGEIVCLYAVDRDRFRDYLMLNTRFETGDTKKHGFGLVEDHPEGGLRILLNLQIRFKSGSGALLS